MPALLQNDVPLNSHDFPKLFVNDGSLRSDEFGLLPSFDPQNTSMEEMRRAFTEDGYLFLKGLIPREEVLEARKRYFEHLSPSGLLKPGTKPVEGVFDPACTPLDYPGIGTGSEGTDTAASVKFQELALSAHGESWYKDVFCKSPTLLKFVANFTGWDDSTMAVERTLLRNNIPKNHAIGVHYDYIFLRHGDDSVLTTWVPMGDVKVDGGGLIYLEKGHEVGRKIEQDFLTKAKLTGLTDGEARSAFNTNMMSGGVLLDGPREFGSQHNRRWLVTAYEAGDVVLHNSYAIHASTVNHDKEGVIRLGTDLRFVDTKRPWDTRWAKVYELNDGL